MLLKNVWLCMFKKLMFCDKYYIDFNTCNLVDSSVLCTAGCCVNVNVK